MKTPKQQSRAAKPESPSPSAEEQAGQRVEEVRKLSGSDLEIAQRRWQAVQATKALWDETITLLTGGDPLQAINVQTWTIVRVTGTPITPIKEE